MMIGPDLRIEQSKYMIIIFHEAIWSKFLKSYARSMLQKYLQERSPAIKLRN